MLSSRECGTCKKSTKIVKFLGSTCPKCNELRKQQKTAQVAAFAEIKLALGNLAEAIKKFEKIRDHH